MEAKTKGKIVLGTNLFFVLVAVYVWLFYSNKSILSFFGLILLFNLIGLSVGTMIVLPFKTKYPKNDGYLTKIFEKFQEWENIQEKDEQKKLDDQLLIETSEAISEYGRMNRY